ncbi:MAG: TonB-dependent receptor [Hyphomonadaceae bacterium]
MTGSFIAGTPETAALPVDVIGVDELERRGNPSTVELMKNLSVSSGVQGDQNQYSSATSPVAGLATVNLRGLGSTRTLVLLNGRRLVTHPSRNGPVDLNSLPMAAVGRVEVLKDGAAATYGSDAIGGVVNFITRKNFDGVLISGSTRFVPDAEDPDLEASALWGWRGDRGDVLVSAGLQTRGRLLSNQRDWNLRSYTENPDAGYSFTNNPTSFRPVVGGDGTALNPGTLATQIRDPGCQSVGALAGVVGGNAVCLARLAGTFVNLVDPTSRWQIYGETNYDLSDTVKFHAEAFYAESYITQITSPGYPSSLGGPTANTSPAFPGQYYAPATNPGLALLMSQFPGAFPANTTGVVWATGLNFRPFGLGGNQLFDTGLGDNGRFDGDGNRTVNDNKAYRISAGVTGKAFGDAIGWDLSSTYSVNQYYSRGNDDLIYRQELALRGFGNLASNPTACNATVTNNYTTNAGNNAVGCYYFNPFSNAYPYNSTVAMTNPGAANPLFSPAAANNPDLTAWIWRPLITNNFGRLFVIDAVLNGELPIELAGGKIGWAAGGQFRRNAYKTSYGSVNDAAVTPCVDTLLNGSKNCLAPIGGFSLQAANFSSDVVQNIYAAFVEFNLPITEDIGAHLAARYEDYGESGGGSTFNPKVDLRWQALDWLAFRGSVGTTFRAPPLPLIDPTPVVNVISLNNAFRAQSVTGNPNLTPEKATTYSVGAIFQAGGFKGTLDYWNFDFKDPFVTEPAATLFAQMFPNNTSVNCGNPAFAELQARFTFDPGTCSANNVSQIALSWVNSGGVKTDGVDFDGQYTFDEVLGGELTLGGNVSWVNKYQVADQVVRGVVLAPAFDAVGKFNYNTGLYAIPQWKGGAYVEWEGGPHNVRLQANYIDGYYDQRTTPFSGNLTYIDPTSGATITVPRPLTAQNVKEFVTADVTYRVLLPWDVSAVFNVSNIFNQDPPLVRMESNYDASVASGLGRTYKLALSKKF